MKLFITRTYVRLESYDIEERECFMEECRQLGMSVYKNQLDHLEAVGNEAQLYMLLYNLVCEWNLSIH